MLAVALGARPCEAWGAGVTEPQDSEAAADNTRELRHTVAVRSSAPDVVTFTVTREFEARRPEAPVQLDLAFHLPLDAVVTSFAFRSGTTWRAGLLGLPGARPRLLGPRERRLGRARLGCRLRPGLR